MTNFYSGKTYISQIRNQIGNQKMIGTGIIAIILNSKEELLLVRGKASGDWGLPAGSQELDESIFDCLKREVKEETNLCIISATPMAIYSDPKFSFVTENGHAYQPFIVAFLVDQWTGTLLTETSETQDAKFFSLDVLPSSLHRFYHLVIGDYEQFTNQVIVR